MSKETLIEELQKLSASDRLFVIEQTLKEMRLQKQDRLAFAAEQLYGDYKNDDSLTAFTALDSEPFYETK